MTNREIFDFSSRCSPEPASTKASPWATYCACAMRHIRKIFHRIPRSASRAFRRDEIHEAAKIYPWKYPEACLEAAESYKSSQGRNMYQNIGRKKVSFSLLPNFRALISFAEEYSTRGRTFGGRYTWSTFPY